MIVYNYFFYLSILFLIVLYKNVFFMIMFCGLYKIVNYFVEVVYIYKGYFFYMCMLCVMEKYLGYVGYLFINDDVMLNYWNLVGMD